VDLQQRDGRVPGEVGSTDVFAVEPGHVTAVRPTRFAAARERPPATALAAPVPHPRTAPTPPGKLAAPGTVVHRAACGTRPPTEGAARVPGSYPHEVRIAEGEVRWRAFEHPGPSRRTGDCPRTPPRARRVPARPLRAPQPAGAAVRDRRRSSHRRRPRGGATRTLRASRRTSTRLKGPKTTLRRRVLRTAARPDRYTLSPPGDVTGATHPAGGEPRTRRAAPAARPPPTRPPHCSRSRRRRRARC
jgi:hypothetical protein